ncbi:glucose 1-dehydrogenase [Caldinitratiruptor microaerophilus]|uniref:2-deoxy-D-gluconate 3-dehydrogenase n=1 Tax=Caldinitratiruptor microaerophilus TaxID=671077 RepID=A0AA35CMU3_9FIRM|nr:glucose 1-dehydrogenase [Caldinitratiruptor microaerophilus]BDG60190.1 2-deoxy-D-gluconate 3-dehydrogenase [Caldinitratiruptor microaerophilus]
MNDRNVLDLFRLAGQVALVTGAASGIGQALAVALAQAGADIALVANRRSPEETVSAIEAAGRRAAVLQADLSRLRARDGEQLVDEVIRRMGRLDILVNCAGTTWRGPALEVDDEAWERDLAVNARAPLFLSRAAARHMAERGRGKIVNVASVLSFQGGVRVLPYAASKHALAGITRALANELAPLGIQVNALAPGYIATEFTKVLQDDPVRNRQILERVPAGRWGQPWDLAGAVVFLASAASDFMTGQVLVVDGGWLSR